MTAIDLKRELKVFYNPPATEVVFVDVPPMNFLMIDGAGDPNPSADYQAAIETLYAVSYALKFTLKRAAQGVDYVVMPSESLWWAGDMDRFSMADKADWRWTMMIAQPPGVDETLLAEVLAQTAKKKALPALTRLRFEKLEEGRCAQIMHIGPYEAEAPTIARLHESISSAGYRRSGKHHEIYLSDPRKAAAEKMRTVLRQPVSK
jgi:hypothetical protein